MKDGADDLTGQTNMGPEIFVPGIARFQDYPVNLKSPSHFSGTQVLEIMASFQEPLEAQFRSEISNHRGSGAPPADAAGRECGLGRYIYKARWLIHCPQQLSLTHLIARIFASSSRRPVCFDSRIFGMLIHSEDTAPTRHGFESIGDAFRT